MATWTTIPDTDLTSGKPGKQYIFRALRDNIDAALSGDASAPKIQSAAFDDGVITAVKLENTTAGDYIILDSSTEVSQAGVTVTKKKEFFIPREGIARIVFTLRTNNNLYTAYGQIYINGSPFGTLRSTTSTAYVTFSEDISGITSGNLIQLYLYSSSSSGITYSNSFQYKASNPLEAVITL